MTLSYAIITRPLNPQIADPATGRIRSEWLAFFDKLVPVVNATMAAGITGGSIGFAISGGGSVLTTGVKGSLRIPYACTITGAYLLADQNGDIQIDIWKDSYGNYPPTNADSITASAPLTLSGAIQATDTTLTGWTTSISAGDIIYFNIDSVANIRRVEISLDVTRS